MLLRGGLLAVVTISEFLRDRYCQDWGLPADRVLVCPDGVDLEAYDREASVTELREKLELPLDRSIAVYTGHLYEQRGIEEILGCAQGLPDVLSLLVGGYPEDVELRRRQVAALGLTNVVLTGYVSNGVVPDYLQAADVLLMPYSRQVATSQWMSPLKLFEYMGAGRPIVASRLPAIEGVLRCGEDALLVEPDSAEALREGVRKALGDPDLARRISRRALERVGDYTWASRADKIIAFCEHRP